MGHININIILEDGRTLNINVTLKDGPTLQTQWKPNPKIPGAKQSLEKKKLKKIRLKGAGTTIKKGPQAKKPPSRKFTWKNLVNGSHSDGVDTGAVPASTSASTFARRRNLKKR
jgi:hypothetical protein